jgi:hypothetical protein
VEGLVEAGWYITAGDGLKFEPEGLNGVGDGHEALGCSTWLSSSVSPGIVFLAPIMQEYAPAGY